MKVLLLTALHTERYQGYREYSLFRDLPFELNVDAAKNNPDFDFRLLMSSNQQAALKGRDSIYAADKRHFALVNSEAIDKLYFDYKDLNIDIFRETAPQEAIDKLKDLYLEALNGFEPDVIICYETPSSHLQSIFPRATLVNQLVSGFGRSKKLRAGYPHYVFSPLPLKDDFLVKHVDFILNKTYRKEEMEFVNDYINEFSDVVKQNIHSNVSFHIKEIRKKYKTVVYCPIEEDHFLFKGSFTKVTINKQLDYVKYIASNMPSDQALVCSLHPASKAQISKDAYRWFGDIHKNVFFMDSRSGVTPLGTQLAFLADSIITSSSFVRFLGLLFQKNVWLVKDSYKPQFSLPFGDFNASFSQEDKENHKKIILYYLRYLTVDLSNLNYKTYESMLEFFKQQQDTSQINEGIFDRFHDHQLSVSKDSWSIASNKRLLNLRYTGFRFHPKDKTHNKMQNMWNQSSVICFDIFDTLLYRNAIAPTDVFSSVALELREIYGDDFSFNYIRSPMENNTRIRAAANLGHEDITIHDIYDYMLENNALPSKEIADQVKAIEIKYEKLYLRRKNSGYSLYQSALAEGKKVIFISDMYLTSPILKEILAVNGYSAFNAMYVSSEAKLKKSSGNLYKLIFKELDINPKKALMIGDNYKADVVAAKEAGMQAIHISNAMNRTYLNNRPLGYVTRNSVLGLDDSILSGFLANKLYDSVPNNYRGLYNGSIYNFGYIHYGPIMFSFCLWLIERCKVNGTKHIYLLKNDGFLIKHSLDLMKEHYDIPFTYSFTPLNRMMLFMLSSNDFNFIMTVMRYMWFQKTPAQIVHFMKTSFNLSDEFSRASEGFLEVNNIQKDMKLKNDRAFTALKPLMNFFFEQKEVQAIVKDTEDFVHSTFTKEDSALFDVGYKGTALYVLNKVLKDRPVKMSYFFVKRGFQLSNSESFFDVSLYIEDRMSTSQLDTLNVVYESVISDNLPSVKFIKKVDGQYVEQYQVPYSTSISINPSTVGALDSLKDILKELTPIKKDLHFTNGFLQYLLSYGQNVEVKSDRLRFEIGNFYAANLVTKLFYNPLVKYRFVTSNKIRKILNTPKRGLLRTLAKVLVKIFVVPVFYLKSKRSGNFEI